MAHFLNLTGMLGAAIVSIMGASGMSQANKPHLSVGCAAQDSKAEVSEEICALFVRELSAALAERGVVPAPQGAASDVTLVVEEASDRRFVARIDQGDVQGPARATARKGAPLDEAAIAALLRGLIKATPGL